jgi:hypothetical protein
LALDSLQDNTVNSAIVVGRNIIGAETEVSTNFIFATEALVLSTDESWGDALDVRVLGTADGTAHVAWADNCIANDFSVCPESTPDNNPPDIFYRAVGSTLTPTLLISDTPKNNQTGDGDGPSSEPAFVEDVLGNIHFVWVEEGSVNGSGDDKDIVHRVMNPSDSSLGPISVVTVEPENYADSNPRLAATDDGAVHMVWQRRIDVGNESDIYYARWKNNAWEPEVLVTDDTAIDGDSKNPGIATNSSRRAFVVWEDSGIASDKDIYYRWIDNNAPLVMGTITKISDNFLDDQQASVSERPAVAMGSDDVMHIVWQDSIEANEDDSTGDIDIWHRSVDTTGGVPVLSASYALVSSASTRASLAPSVAVRSDNEPIVSWTEQADTTDSIPPGESINNSDIYYADGATALGVVGFDGGSEVVNNPKRSAFPSIAAIGTTAHIVWEDDTTLLANDKDRNGDLNPPLSSDDLDTDIFYMTVEAE